MKAIEVKPKEREVMYPKIEVSYLSKSIAGFVECARRACDIYPNPAQAVILVELLKEHIDIWFGDLVTIEEKEN